ncbi:DUF899 domain-containing protein [Micromonospora sp. WMMC415]|uniref:DUF899 domain-containing protein n=1 Tax=Micromonospora sp. WMMC415 TaxID=2675222 RepID=UPI0012B4E93E|nr:DUF899 domain-containing protein [Micromonospora sp. WMMC415]QGN48238.1 DUF899 domain-containing protein [Micromonospora sp. WMMC415]
MDDLKVVSQEEWLAVRTELLDREKHLTRLRDEVTALRRRMPAVVVEKDYRFAGPDGPVRLRDMFEGRRQLVVYHFMFDPSWSEGCTSCSFLVDNLGHLAHLHAGDTTFVAVSRAPLSSIAPFKARMGWTFPWYSSHGSDFNYDFHVTLDEAVAPVAYNYKDRATLEREGLAHHLHGEAHGLSVFVADADDRVLHTYSTYGRGLDAVLTTYHYLDLTPLGRQRYVNEFPHHDRYEGVTANAGHCH